MRFLLDTSVVIGPPLLTAPDAELAISAITVSELHFGVLVARSPETKAIRLARLSRLLRHFEPLPVDAAVAENYGVMAAAVAASGRSPRPRALDLLIAATAAAHGAKLLTRKQRDFVGLEDVVDVKGV